MAGGHKFRGKNGEKLRFKAMHKVNDYHRRFGKHQCVGCGRCDDVCPQYISFARCINTLSDVIEKRKRK
jgi:anaerobic sulfite reductase subunit A